MNKCAKILMVCVSKHLGSGSERDIKSSKTIKREIKVTYQAFLYLFTDDDKSKLYLE